VANKVTPEKKRHMAYSGRRKIEMDGRRRSPRLSSLVLVSISAMLAVVPHGSSGAFVHN
jgi:hypothetical protein